MQPDGESTTEVRRKPQTGLPDAEAPPFRLGDALSEDEGPPRSRYLVRVLSALLVALGLAVLGYETFVAPKDDAGAFTPPAGLTAEETPPWLQALCAKRTPELCAAADRARNPSDCASLNATLRALEAVERKLSARGAVTQRQHWVLTELYGQGHQLCQFVRGAPLPE